jgi:hypothetical protein
MAPLQGFAKTTLQPASSARLNAGPPAALTIRIGTA